MTSSGKNPLVSVVVPALNEEPNIELLLGRFDDIKDANPAYRFEFVVVDDGSTDSTRELLLQARSSRSDLVVLALTRNFGSHYAFSAGLEACNGDCAIGIGADLQEPLDLISRFLEEWQAGSDVVWGIREVRKQGIASRFMSRAFSIVLTRYSDIEGYPAEGPSGFLVSRVVIDVVTTMPETNRNLLGLIAWSGFRQSRVSYQQTARTGGTSKWTTTKKLKLAVDSFVEFSHAPVRFMTYIGTFIAILGFLYAAVVSVRRLAWDNPIEGWTTVIVTVTIIGGLNLMMLGVLGEYIWRATDETRRRPLYVVQPLPEADATPDPSSEASEDHVDL